MSTELDVTVVDNQVDVDKSIDVQSVVVGTKRLADEPIADETFDDVDVDDDFSSDSVSVLAEQQPAPKKSTRAAAPKRKKTVDGPMTTNGRRPSGYTMLKAEHDKLLRSYDALIRKRTHKQEVDGKRSVTLCVVLLNNIIDFYETAIADYEKKFKQYM